MKARFLSFLFILLSIAIAFSFVIDDDPVQTLLSKLDRFRNEYPQEKVHLHFDKPYYTIGETIWFKAYVVDAENNHPSSISEILYVDLINEKDSVARSLRLSMIAGLAWGDINLTGDLREGNYRVRAYTNWMRNFNDEYFFDKTIRIGDALSNTVLAASQYVFSKNGDKEKIEAAISYKDFSGKPFLNKEVNYSIDLEGKSIARGKEFTDSNGNIKISFINDKPLLSRSAEISTSIQTDGQNTLNKRFAVRSASGSADVQFFPEGGQLVDGLSSKVGFKAVGADGLGTDISGYVLDKDNSRINEFESSHDGMGAFALTPAINNNYTAVVKFFDGSEKKIVLPKSLQEGYVLSVINTDTANLYIRISASKNLLKNGELVLVAQSNSLVQYVSKPKMESEVLNAVIPKKRFKTGILQLTLFASQRPVAERLVFINHEDQIRMAVSTDKPSYGKREKVRMTIDANDQAGKPIIGSFSVAVTDMTKVPSDEADEPSILSDLLLSSDLRGYIEKPNYYFAETNKEKIQQLDNLLLTQGWRRFEWKNIQTDVFPSAIFKPEQGIRISGSVSMPNGSPVAAAKVTVFATGGFMTDVVTDPSGRFVIDGLSFKDSTQFAIKAQNIQDTKNLKITLDRIPAQLVARNKNAAEVQANASSSLLTYLKNSRIQFEEMQKYGLIKSDIILNEVNIRGERIEGVKNSANLNGPGAKPDVVIRANQIEPSCTNLYDCLRGKVGGLVIKTIEVPKGRSYQMMYLARFLTTTILGQNPAMLLVIDGMKVEQGPDEYFKTISPKEIETIEVLREVGNTAVYGLQGTGGVLVITTKRAELSTPSANMSYSPKGYYAARTFYSPNYDEPVTNKEMSDLRTTIYWNPILLTGSDGKVSFDYFTADSPGTYRVVIEGLDDSGKLGRKTYSYKVQ